VTSCNLFAAIFFLAVSGCGTVLNLRDFENRSISRYSILKRGRVPTPKMVYGGVRMDAAVVGGYLQTSSIDPPAILLAGYVGLIDLPLSAVADTVTLPITIPAAINRSGDDHQNHSDRESTSSVLKVTVRDLTPEEFRIVEIAKEAVKHRHAGEIEAEAPNRTDDGWSVDVWALPKSPDGFVSVRLDKHGNVKSLFGF
jgi:uncharacterized protein YceK